MGVNIYELAQTWNAGGSVFKAIEMDVTDTASAAGSKLLDLLVGGTSKFAINRDLASAEDDSFLDMAHIWNTTGTPTALKLNVTDTASHADSLLMDLQVGGSSKVSVNKDGGITLPTAGNGGRLDGYIAYGITLGSNSKRRAYVGGTNSNHGLLITSGGWLGFSSTSDSLTSANPDTYLYRDAANTFAQRNSTNAQTFNIYNTYTDGSNYERGFLKWNSNVLEFGTEAAGTGTNRQIRLGSNAAEATRGWLDITFSGYMTTISTGASSNIKFGSGAGVIFADNKFVSVGTGTSSFGNDGAQFEGISGDITFGFRENWGYDQAVGDFIFAGCDQYASASTNLLGGNVVIIGGEGSSGSAGAAHGGNIVLTGGTGYGTGDDGKVTISALLTELRDGTNAQTFNFYNTYTDASNYERGFMRWNSNVLEIGTEAAGTGTDREFHLVVDGNDVLQAGGSLGDYSLIFGNNGGGSSGTCDNSWAFGGYHNLGSVGGWKFGAGIQHDLSANANYMNAFGKNGFGHSNSLLILSDITWSQGTRAVQSIITTDATPATLGAYATTAKRLLVREDYLYGAEITVVAINTAGTDFAVFRRYALIENDSGTTSLVGSVQTLGTDIGSNAGSPPAGWAIAITADDTNDALQTEVTGEAATTIRWASRLDLIEVGY